ncbi:MAG: DUF1456 family protein [Pontibacterium sp.]
MDNNTILKKLRIALDLKDPDMYQIFELAGCEVNKSELSGYFRKPGHKNFRKCSNETLESFLDGYITFKRGDKSE